MQPGAAQRLRFFRRNPEDSPKLAGEVPGDVPGLSTSIIEEPYVEIGSDDETLRLLEVTKVAASPLGMPIEMGCVTLAGLAVTFSGVVLPVVAVSEDGVDVVVAGAGDLDALPNKS